MTLIDLLVLILVAGAIAWLIGRAPFIEPPYKVFAQYVILVFVVLFIIFKFFPNVLSTRLGLAFLF